MPIFEFDCGRCGLEFEKLVPAAGTKVRCPRCGSTRVEKRFSLFGMKSGGGASGSAGGSSCAGCSSKNCSSCS